ncbi:MAG: hypothetical protein J6Q58_01715 [Clostridia bacterium]|nr:hypothetical protein [Clostridia bacterium]
MKKFIVLLAFIFLTTSVKFFSVSAKENFAIQSQIIIKDIEADLTGDGKVEKVILTGSQKESSPLYENIKITVSDNKTGVTLFSITPTTNIGYEPTIMLGDFTLDGLPELFYGALDSTCEFGYYYLYAFSDSVITLYDYESDFCSCKAVYRDWYNVEVSTNENTYNIDISNKDYIGYVYSGGKLKKEMFADISKGCKVSPYYDVEKQIYTLLVARKITGIDRQDLIGYLVDNYSFNENQTMIKKSYFIFV